MYSIFYDILKSDNNSFIRFKNVMVSSPRSK